MTTNIGLSSGLKNSLYSLQDIGGQITSTNNRLATGRKVNSALDNALNYFLAQGFTTRSTRLSSVLDNVNLSLNTITQANSALTSITSSLNQALGTLRSALNSAGTQARVTAAASFRDALGNTVNASTAAASFVIDQTFSQTNAFSSGDVLSIGIQTSSSTGNLTTVGTASFTITGGTTVQALLNNINTTAAFNAGGTNSNVLTASISDSGNLVIEQNVAGQQSNTTSTQIFALNISLNTTARTTTGLTGQFVTSVFNFAGGVGNTAALTSNTTTNQSGAIVSGTTQQTTRNAAATAFRQVLTQISQSASDAGFNGTNLLNGDFLTTVTNDSASSSIVTQGQVINSTNLGFRTDVTNSTAGFAGLQTYNGDAVRNFQSDSEIRSAITRLTSALGRTEQIATNLSTNTNLLQNRLQFTTSSIRTLNDGADTLTLADINQEGANLTSLQTRQQLAVQALSLANRSDQSILRLFG